MNEGTPPADDESRSHYSMDPNETKTLGETKTLDNMGITINRGIHQPDTETKTLRRPRNNEETSSEGTLGSGSTTKVFGTGDDVMRTMEAGESQIAIEDDIAEESDKEEAVEEATRRSVSWSHPDFQTDWSDFEILIDNQLNEESELKIDAVESFYPGIHPEEGKVHINETHGYTFIETTETDAYGNKKTVRKFLPRIHQKTRTYRKLIPVRVTFTKLINDVELVEEEEYINEEMEVEEIIDTCLVKKKDPNGEEYEEEKEITRESIKYPGKKKKLIKLRMVNDLGEVVEELIELNDDPKRTNDIMKLAVPFLKKKTNASDMEGDKASLEGYGKDVSMFLPENYKAKDTQKDLIKMKIIERLKVARDEQKALKEMNKFLGKRLCEFYDLKGPKDPQFAYDERGNSEEEKQKYQKRLLEFNDVINFIFNENKNRAEMISQAEKDTQHDAEELNKEKQNFYGLEEAMLKDIDVAEESKTLRSMTFADLINHQKAMDNSLAKVRLDFIRSQITLKDLEDKKAAHQDAIDKMEKVDFISFESLRFKTKDLNDKLDLKEKQVLTMKDRLTQRVQALAHVRLKSDHLTVENEKLRSETKDIVEELNALRKECLIVQIERRKLEKQLSKVSSKEGIEKYPYLVSEAPTVEAKGEEQMELLCQLVNKCTNLKSQMKDKLEEHNKGVDKYKEIQDNKKQKKKLYSLV